MDYLDFSEEEIQEQLEILGYKNIPKHRLREFKQELDELIRCGEWKAFTSVAQKHSTKPQPISQPSPPAYTKEKVSQCYIRNSGEGFFLHSSKADEEKQVLTTCQNRDNGRQQEYTDSYAQHSVAPKLQLPAGAPSRLQLEPDPEDTLQPPLTDSYTSSPDYRGRCLIKRKVLRKHKGQSLVCDESFYSEYSEKHEEEEEIIERMVIEDEAKFVAEAEASLLEASEEDKPKLKDQGNFTEEGSKDGSNVVEEEEKTERVVNEEDSVFVAEDEDSLQKDSEEEIEQVVNDEDSNHVSEEEHSLQEDSEKEDGSKGERPELDSEGNSSSESYNRQSVDEEAEKMEHVVVETEDDLQEDSEDEKPEVNNKENLTSGSSEEGSDDDYDGDDDDEEENERVFSEEDLFQPVVEADDPLLVASEEKNRHNDKEVQIEPKVKEEDFKTLYKTDSLQKDSAKEKPEENNHKNFPTWSWEDDDDDEQNCTISCSSTAPSLITSGYGTYRLEEQEGGDHTITEFDQDSRGDLSEMRDNEEDVESFSSYGGFDVERDLRENQNENKLDFPVASCERGGRREEVDTEDLKSNNNKDLTEEKCEDLHTESENKEGQQRQPYTAIYEDTLLKLEKHLEAIQSDPEEGGGYEKLHEEEQNHVKKKAKSKVELEDSDESLNNKDIKFIDSKVDFNWAMYKKMLEEWEGNLRQKTDTISCLEERLAEVDLSTSPQRDLETEHEDVVSQRDTLSSEADGISLSAFESYIRGMTQAEGDGHFRPKPKSFIRPVMSQQSVKKTDPVSKYFQYKQFWEMYKLPGERDRKDLRWEIKERLAYQPPPPKPRRVLVPNTYVVPTEKKRSALRWEVRNDLANGVLPHKFNYQF